MSGRPAAPAGPPQLGTGSWLWLEYLLVFQTPNMALQMPQTSSPTQAQLPASPSSQERCNPQTVAVTLSPPHSTQGPSGPHLCVQGLTQGTTTQFSGETFPLPSASLNPLLTEGLEKRGQPCREFCLTPEKCPYAQTRSASSHSAAGRADQVSRCPPAHVPLTQARRLVPSRSSAPCPALGSFLCQPWTPDPSQGLTRSQHLNPVVPEPLEGGRKGWQPVRHQRCLEPPARAQACP